MDRRTELLRIFGLSAVASKSDIRRAYRKLAMQHHPDKNPDPKAHQRFIQLTAAYEELLADKFEEVKPLIQPRKAQTHESRMKQAQKRYVNQQKYQIKEQQFYFQKLTSGRRWKIFQIQVIVSTFLAFILLIEPWIEKHFHFDEVVGYSSIYNGLEKDMVRCISTKNDLEIFIESIGVSPFMSDPTILVETSWFTHQPIRIWHQTPTSKKAIHVDFSFNNLYPSMSLFFLIPLFTFFYRKKNYYFTFLYLFSQYIVGAIVVYLLVTQDRWAHLITFGLV